MEKLPNQSNLSAHCYDMGSLLWIKWETLGVGFNVNSFRFLERKWLNYSYGRMIGNAFDPLPLPSGVPVPMCFYGDSCKIAKSDEEDIYIDRGIGCVLILRLSLHFVSAALTRW